ncbi:MAG: hypothetical protein U1F43_09880 [Myxococcota bacterium]
MTLRRSLLLTPLVAGLVACGEDSAPVKGDKLAIAPAAIADDSVANFRALAHDVWTVDQWLSATKSVDLLDDLLGSGADVEVTPTPGANQIFLPEDELEFESFLDDVEAFFREHAFTEGQVESKSDTEVIYRLTAAGFCDPDWGDECARAIEATELRFRVVSFAPGDIDVTLLVGAERRAAVQFELHHDVASIEIQVEPSLAVAKAILDAAVESGDAPSDAGVSGSGSVKLVVRRLAENQVRVSAEVTSAVTLTATSEGDTYSVELGEGSTALELDAASGRATADIDMGRVALTAPKSAVVAGPDCYEDVVVDEGGNETTTTYCDGEEVPAGDPLPTGPDVTGTVSIELARTAAYFDFVDSDRRFDLRGLVLGPAKLLVDQQTIVEASLDDGATALDFHLVLLDDDSGELSLSRAAHAGLLLRLGLAPEVFEDMGDSFMADEDLGVKVEGATPKAIALQNGLFMSSGKITLTSKHAKNPTLVIDEGMCAWYPDSEETTAVDGSGTGSDSGSSDEPHPFDLEVANQCPDPSAP